MQLHSADLSPFARKVRIVVAEKGLGERVEIVSANPYEAKEALLAANPLSKVPTLVLDDGSVLYDSAVICDYLDSLAGPSLMPADESRFVARRRLALADGLLEAAFSIGCERNRRPEGERSPAWIERWAEALRRGVAAAAADASDYGDALTLPHIGLVCALDYIDLRADDLLDWRASHPSLVAWYGTFGEREAMIATRPPG